MPQNSPDRSLRVVVAAVVERDDGRILLARRLPDAHLGGLWEFPGGAVEDGETPEEALSRELVEELGVVITVAEPITFAFHRDERRDVVLLFHAARIVQGRPRGLQGQEVRWFAREELAALATPPADAALVRHLSQA
jgi:8-oxo-dGTP diphosphatase